MTQKQCDICARVESLRDIECFLDVPNKTCKQAAENVYKEYPDAICTDFMEIKKLVWS